MPASAIYENLRRALCAVGIHIRPDASTPASSSPAITATTGAPSASEPNGSINLRTNGDLAQRIGGAWVTALSGGRASNLATGAMFRTASPVTATGSAQNVAHGLGSTPSLVWVFAVSGHNGSGGAGTQMPTISLGTHTSTNIVVTCTAGATFTACAIR